MVILDYETKSLISLPDVGAHVYAAHPSTEIILLAYQVDDAEPRVWLPSTPLPADLTTAISSGQPVWAFNAAFDRQIWERCMPAGTPEIAFEQWNDAMAVAAYRCLPMSLEDCAHVLGLAEKKADTGAALIKKYCKPISKRNLAFRPIPPEDLDEFAAYALQDVRTTRAIVDRIGDLSPGERQWWLLEQEINDRGIGINVPAVQRAIEIVELESARIAADLSDLTNGRITAATQSERFTALAAEMEPGLMASCGKVEVVEALGKVENATLRRILELRQEGSMSGVKKLARMLSGSAVDGRARGLMQYHAATTGREGGRRVQPQNLFRPDEDFGDYGIVPDTLLACGTAAEAIALLGVMYPRSPSRAVANLTRNFLVPGKGKVLVAGDYSSVEAIVNAALAGEEKKLQGIRDVHAGLADDIYCVAATGIYGYTVKKKTHKLERQVGKIAELASGFQGSVGAWVRFGADKLGWTEEQILEKVKAWRAAHPNIVKSWYAYEAAATQAVQNPGRVVEAGPVAFRMRDGWLRCRLPSGRLLHYFNPRCATGKFGGDTFGYWAMKPLPSGGRAWTYRTAYGGLLCENIVQAVSRDLMVAAAFRLEAAGYPIVLTVHDELVAEVLEARADVKEFEQIMSEPLEWSRGWPIKAEAWAGPMYAK